MNASVVIPTLRHGTDACEALASVLDQVPPDADVILVRSATPSDLPLDGPLARVVAERSVRVVAEPEPGIARARARGLAACRHDVVLFVDDDVVARPGWYGALTAAMADPTVGAAGGSIVPVWPSGRPPRWLPDSLRPSYGERHAGPRSGQRPFGANMALRRSLAAAAGGVPLHLGHDGRRPGLHEETALCERLETLGHPVVEVPDAVVDHKVRPEQARVGWVWRRAWYEGRCDLARDRYVRVPEPGRRAAKLSGLLLVWPLSLVRLRWAVHVTARILANAGYLRAWLTSPLPKSG